MKNYLIKCDEDVNCSVRADYGLGGRLSLLRILPTGPTLSSGLLSRRPQTLGGKKVHDPTPNAPTPRTKSPGPILRAPL
jgi:hypothetical protein